jgi:LacI family transcriptional regulator
MTLPHENAAPRAATRTDVAKLAGVSAAVVSYVVNNGPRPVATATRKRVEAAMEQLDYRPNALARALKLRRAQAVGVVVPDVSNTFFGALARELSNQAFETGYALLLGDADNDIERERAQIESLVSHQIDGLIITSLEPGSVVDARGTRTVFLGQRTLSGQTSIVVDNEGGARMAVEQPIAALAAAALEAVVGTQPVESSIVPVSLVIRSSCGCDQDQQESAARR